MHKITTLIKILAENQILQILTNMIFCFKYLHKMYLLKIFYLTIKKNIIYLESVEHGNMIRTTISSEVSLLIT